MAGVKRKHDEIDGDAKQDEDVTMDDVISPPVTKKRAASEFDVGMLKLYYEEMFPYDYYCRWLSYGNMWTDKLWCSREFSFTSEYDGNEIYKRYNSFEDLTSFKRYLKKYTPHKIDIGAVFNHKPKDKLKHTDFHPEQRELVFDIDISDYDDVRTCCQDKQVCDECWPLMNCAIKCLDDFLRNDFGFQSLLFIFSGRRGIHCWIGDEHARLFSNEVRHAIVSYLCVVIPENRTSNIDGIHDMLLRAYDICLPYFESCSIDKQHVLGDVSLGEEKSRQLILQFTKYIRNPGLRELILDEVNLLGTNATSRERWEKIQELFNKAIEAEDKNFMKRELRYNLMEIVFYHTYPRVDVEVSKHMNHLLKSPFCVHPKTGKLCIPIDPATCDEFSPVDTPTLRTLKEELDAAKTEKDGKKTWKDIPTMIEQCSIWDSTFLSTLSRPTQVNDDMEF